MKKVTVITGHYGSGKTNISVNLAVDAARAGAKVSVVDLDIVNPYFRTADFGDLFSKNGIELVSSVYANSNLDIPAITFDIETLAEQEGCLIVDVGGDDSGAVALARYKGVFEGLEKSGDIDMFYVINMYRYLTKTPEEAAVLLKEIEAASRFKHTGMINNSNLGYETTAETVLNSLDYADEVSKLTGLPVVFTAASVEIKTARTAIRPVKRYVKPLWEQ